ncbi:MAG: DUF4918 family protein [Bacteroidota bacterium]|nr:DUF4918 family protein [Bacteroidota bacterium]
MTFAQQILEFITHLDFPPILPNDIEVMNPYKDVAVKNICEKFYREFYNDNNKRWMIIGINPGRFGAGVTGIPFTDPIRLQKECSIENDWSKKQELSSLFVYDMINAFGGIQSFYKKFYITAVSPLGFTKHNKNLNYYDDKELMNDIKSFVIECMNRQLQFGIYRNAAFCLGEGKNFVYLRKLNAQMHFFESIVPLPHPRFIMQYRLKKKEEYIKFYLAQFHKYI